MIIQATGLSFLRRSFFICEKGIEPYLQGGGIGWGGENGVRHCE